MRVLGWIADLSSGFRLVHDDGSALDPDIQPASGIYILMNNSWFFSRLAAHCKC